MLPLSHVYISVKATRRRSPLLIFGSVLPDVAWTSKSEIGRDEIHGAPKEFYNFTIANHPKFIDLALGVMLHSDVERGVDYYSDDKKAGYAIQEGKKISADVAKMLEEEDGSRSLKLAHSFIEAGVDLNLKESFPEVLETYGVGLRGIDKKEISEFLADYLKKESEIVFRELENFVNLFNVDTFLSQDKIANAIVFVVKERMGNKIDIREVIKILNSAKEITKNTFQDFLDDVIENLKKDFAVFINPQKNI